MKEIDRILEAISSNIDAITFWQGEDRVVPIMGTIIEEKNDQAKAEIRPFPCEVTIE